MLKWKLFCFSCGDSGNKSWRRKVMMGVNPIWPPGNWKCLRPTEENIRQNRCGAERAQATK
jgi:hypothetical protein